jgi:hypothetical protein
VGPAFHIALGSLVVLAPLCTAIGIVLGVELLIVRPSGREHRRGNG